MSAIAPDGASAASEPTSAPALSRRRRCNASAGSRSARSNVASTAAAPPRSIPDGCAGVPNRLVACDRDLLEERFKWRYAEWRCLTRWFGVG